MDNKRMSKSVRDQVAKSGFMGASEYVLRDDILLQAWYLSRASGECFLIFGDILQEATLLRRQGRLNISAGQNM